MTARATLRLLICLLPALTLSAQQFILRGTVLLVDET